MSYDASKISHPDIVEVQVFCQECNQEILTEDPEDNICLECLELEEQDIEKKALEASRSKVLDVMLREQHSRKFRFNEIERKLNAPYGALGISIRKGLDSLLSDYTIGEVYIPRLGILYYVTGSKQDPNYSK